MSSIFYLFLPRINKTSSFIELDNLSWVYKNVNNELKQAQGTLSDAAIVAHDYSVTVVLQGEDVLHLKAEIPAKNIQHARQALPYALEDSVIDDVDDLHFSIFKLNENNYDVAIIHKVSFQSIIEQLEKAGINPDVITADYFLLSDNNKSFSRAERILFNDNELKFSSHIDNISDFSDSIEFDEVADNLPLTDLVKNSSNVQPINLLQGEFKKLKKWSEVKKRWLPTAAALMVLLTVQCILFIVDYVGFNNKNQLLKTEINTIYKKTFPNAKRIINAKAQMQQKLNVLKKSKGQGGRSFTHILTNSAAVFSQTKGLVIKSLRYYDGRINIELKIASLQALETLKIQLSKENNYKVNIKNASSSKSGVTAQLQIAGVAL